MDTYKSKYQSGGTKSKYTSHIRGSRKGTRLNFLDKPVTHSTHLMSYSEFDGKYYVYPTLFQDEKGNWYERSGTEAYKEAKKRGEIYQFNTEKEAAEWAGPNAPWKNSGLDGKAGPGYQKGGQKSEYVSAVPQDKDNYILNAGMLPEINIEEKDPRNWLQKNYQKYISPIGHGALDVLGMIPAAGELADGINALWYSAEGNKIDAALSTAAMIPFAGWLATTGKWGKNTIKAMDKVTPGGGGMYQQLKYLQEVNPKLAAELGIKNKKQIKNMLKNDPAAAQKIIDDANVGKVFDGKVASTSAEAATKEVKRVNDYNITNTNTVIDPAKTYRKSAIGMNSRTHPMRGGHLYDDIAGEYTWLDDASKISDHVAAPFNPRFNESGSMISFDLTKYDDYVPFTSHKMQFPDIPHTKFKTDLSGTMADLQNKGFHHMDMHGGNVLVQSDKVGNILDYKIIDPVGYTHDFQKSQMFLQNNPAYQNFDNMLKFDQWGNDLVRIKSKHFKHGGVRNKVKTKKNDFIYNYINKKLKRFK